MQIYFSASFIKLSLALVSVLLIALISACGFIRPEKLQMIPPLSLQKIMAQRDILLVDVHVPEQKHILGTDHHIAFYRIQENNQLFPSNKTDPIYLYCETGPMANWAARSLYSMGYTNIFSLDGGMDAWLAAGLPIESNPNSNQNIH